MHKKFYKYIIGFILLIVLLIVFLILLNIRMNLKRQREESYQVTRCEDQILAWEYAYDETLEFSEDERYHTLESMRSHILSSDLEFTEEQQKRVDELLSKIDASLAEFGESEDTSSVESGSSEESDLSYDS